MKRLLLRISSSIQLRMFSVICSLMLCLVAALTSYFSLQHVAAIRRGLEHKADTYGRLVGREVESAVAFDDRQTVREIFDATATDKDVRAMALYGESGGALYVFGEPVGPVAVTLGADSTPRIDVLSSAIRATLSVVSREGPRGTLVIELSTASLDAERTAVLQASVAAALAALAFGLLAAWLLARSIGGRLRAIARVTVAVAEGDLSQPRLVDSSSDEVGQLAEAFNRMINGQQAIVQQIAKTSEQLAFASSAMYSASQEQSAAVSLQSSEVDQVTRTMQSLLESAARITEQAEGVLSNAEQTRQTANTTANKLAELSGHTNRIGEILEIIRGIADRSDLLALNASIEGSRAGEAGRTFSLVAAEMRRLAESVTDSVEDVKALVDDVRASGSSTVMATEEGRRLAESTTESARAITRVTEEQRSGTEQVSRSMTDIATVLTQSVSATKQTRALAEELKHHADRLAEVVGRFQLRPKRSPASYPPVAQAAPSSLVWEPHGLVAHPVPFDVALGSSPTRETP